MKSSSSRSAKASSSRSAKAAASRSAKTAASRSDKASFPGSAKGSSSGSAKASPPRSAKGPSSGSAKASPFSPAKGSSSGPAKVSSPQSSDADALEPVDENFLQQLRKGAHLFHYSRQGDAAASFEKSPSAEYTMYSVIDVPTENDIILTRSFDEKEEKKSYTWDDLLAGDWWYNPEAPHEKI